MCLPTCKDGLKNEDGDCKTRKERFHAGERRDTAKTERENKV